MELLGRGEFFGRQVAAEQLGGFALSLTRYDGRTSIPWHAHDEPYVTFVMRGAYRERLRGVTRDCTPRTMLLHPAGERHADDFARPAVCLNVHLDSGWLGGLTRRGVAVDSPAMLTTPASSAIGARLSRELRRNDALSPMVIEGLMLELFAESVRSPEGHRAPSWLRSVRETIEARFTERLTISMLAAHAGVHPVHLARAFRQHYGGTIGELLRELRVDYAKRRIAAGAPLTQIALDAGFADQSHLTRTFRTVTGATPTEYRRLR
jgi:AraC family transcriptional regulator